MSTYIYRPEVTFEDTNLVGNVYFANFVRWQNECRDDWLRSVDFKSYDAVFRGDKRFVVTDLSLKFQDPVGATVGSLIDIEMDVRLLQDGLHEGKLQMRRRGVATERTPLAAGYQRFALINGNDDFPCLNATDCGDRRGPAYVLEFPLSLNGRSRNAHIEVLDLIRWQGKCRERFLADFARSTLEFVVARSLALHTSQLSFQLLRDVRVESSDSLMLEMRLAHLKGGRLTVEFDYYLTAGPGRARSRHRIAVGSQSLCCKRGTTRGLAPVVFPPDMLRALRRFTESNELRASIDEAIDFAHGDANLQDILCGNVPQVAS